jgi:SRSO17 transposase
MLPACRTDGEGFSMPQLDLTPREVEGFRQELTALHTLFQDCFTRWEPREHFLRSMVGQFSDLERQSIEPIALEVEGGNMRAMQRLLSDVVWDEDHRRWTSHPLVHDDLGAPDGVLLFDESGCPKKGQDAVGVARQYCGTLGKVANGQVGVFAA